MTPDAELLTRTMHQALALAERGRGFVEPNPMVGAVVLDAAGSPVGEGWHRKFGEAHAEVNAFAEAGEQARGGTLVVTLEPCCHWGKTPPCTEAVLTSGVRRVVVAMADPFPRVAGGGLGLLREAGLEVIVGIGEADALRLNAPYLKLLRTGRPWVHLKWAMSLDGRIATRTGDSKWISGEASRRITHEQRGRLDAILVGRGTVLADDPRLTARPPGPRTATRVVVTHSGDLPERCALRATARECPVLVFTSEAGLAKLAAWRADGCEVIGLPCDTKALPIGAILDELGRRRMTNILVEGGAGLLGSFVDARAVDEVHVFVAPKILGGHAALGPVGGSGTAKLMDALAFAEWEGRRSGDDLYWRGVVSAG